ncbi:MAG: HD domain-containing protein [Pirellulaceae bacterium]|nr:HD domain-containing protein [Pirellulaceae bacterium]
MSQLLSPNQLLELLASQGGAMYGGEAVTQLEHALQAAMLAEQERATPELITAALLHDIGHLSSGLSEKISEHQVDDRHEHRALALLESIFPITVTEPIRMHVDAKRYLCTVDPNYEAKLSPASVVSLRLQGGRMSSREVEAFQAHSLLADALRLRGWDDQAKVAGLPTPPLSHFASYVSLVSRTESDADE